jgi:predicted enzyme related to lactoylglutathione lyase
MTVRLIALEFDAVDPARLAAFWAPLLGCTPEGEGTRLPGLPGDAFELRFLPVDQPTSGRHRMHPDLTSTTDEDQRDTVDLALRLGARHLDVGQRGDEGHVVLADPEGNEFCVIEAGNRFLADTERIGALAGDGMPEVGYFWSAVLDWPLVWDQDEETAIQSPHGGTKITWGGPPVRPKTGRNRLRWVLSTDDLEDELRRLRELGAGVTHQDPQQAELVDPEGNEFILTTDRSAVGEHG